MTTLYISILILAITGLVSLLCNRLGERVTFCLGSWGCYLSFLAGFIGVVRYFLSISGLRDLVFHVNIGLPDGDVDLLMLLFTFNILVIGSCAALHARGYLHNHIHGRTGYFWFFFNMTLAAMLSVVAAPTRLAFLVAWELMGLFSFALVAFEYRERKAMSTAWTYLLACQAGGLLLIFNLAVPHAGHAVILSSTLAGLIAFGLKIGFPGLHTWLPEAHPAAPAPVSAVMSGAMIPLGFYGILIMWFPYESTAAAGWILLVCGLVAAPFGMLMGASQNNLKRLLAYSSVENMGIISIGFGLCILGTPDIFYLALAGAIVHILNHALLKGTLFLGAGSILKSTGTLSIDSMGGLIHRMPRTGTLFAISAFSLCGLPPGNAFLGEFLIYTAAFKGLLSEAAHPSLKIACAAVILVLALTGGLAAAVYAKAVGGVFLGEPRSKAAADATEAAPCMQWAMLLLTIGSFLMFPAIIVIMKTLAVEFVFFDTEAIGIMIKIIAASLLLILLTCCVITLRRRLPRGRIQRNGPTWDCGYAAPTARMEYTGTAFVQPILDYFAPLLNTKRNMKPADGLFPQEAHITLTATDWANRALWNPVQKLSWRAADLVHRLQSGSIHLYILFMLLALAAMFIWGFTTSAPDAINANELQQSDLSIHTATEVISE